MTTPRTTIAAVFGLALTLSGCAANTTHAYLEGNANLKQYQRYAWAPPEKSATGDSRLDNNGIYTDRVEAAVDNQLAAKGFRKSSAAKPDLLVRMHTSVEQRVDLKYSDPFTPCTDCTPTIYDTGKLVIDLVDTRTNQVVWRGWSERNVDGVIDNQRWLEKRMDQTVKRIFEQLPAR